MPVRVQQPNPTVTGEIAERTRVLAHSFPLMGKYSDFCVCQPQGAAAISAAGVVSVGERPRVFLF
jgi:hypothetical protein